MAPPLFFPFGFGLPSRCRAHLASLASPAMQRSVALTHAMFLHLLLISRVPLLGQLSPGRPLHRGAGPLIYEGLTREVRAPSHAAGAYVEIARPQGPGPHPMAGMPTITALAEAIATLLPLAGAWAASAGAATLPPSSSPGGRPPVAIDLVSQLLISVIDKCHYVCLLPPLPPLHACSTVMAWHCPTTFFPLLCYASPSRFRWCAWRRGSFAAGLLPLSWDRRLSRAHSRIVHRALTALDCHSESSYHAMSPTPPPPPPALACCRRGKGHQIIKRRTHVALRATSTRVSHVRSISF